MKFLSTALVIGGYLIAQTLAAGCYLPNGQEAPEDVVCFPKKPNSHCCWGGGNGGAPQACLSNRLCVADPHSANWTLHRGSCTDRSFTAEECPTFCKVPVNDGAPVFSCNQTGVDNYCCGNSCSCDAAETTSILKFQGMPTTATIIGEAYTPTGITSSATSSSSGVPLPTKSNAKAIGAGVGVGVGGLIILMVVCFLLLQRRKSKRDDEKRHPPMGMGSNPMMMPHFDPNGMMYPPNMQPLPPMGMMNGMNGMNGMPPVHMGYSSPSQRSGSRSRSRSRSASNAARGIPPPAYEYYKPHGDPRQQDFSMGDRKENYGWNRPMELPASPLPFPESAGAKKSWSGPPVELDAASRIRTSTIPRTPETNGVLPGSPGSFEALPPPPKTPSRTKSTRSHATTTTSTTGIGGRRLSDRSTTFLHERDEEDDYDDVDTRRVKPGPGPGLGPGRREGEMF